MFPSSAKPFRFGKVPLEKGDLGGLQYVGASKMPINAGFANSGKANALNI